MTREEKLAKLKEHADSAELKVKDYNNFYQEKQFDEATKVEAEIDDLIEKHGAMARTIFYDDCAATDDPMIAAVKKLTYETIATKDSMVGENKETKLKKREIVKVDKPIDLLKLHKYVEGGIGADKEWPYLVEKLNLLLTAQKAIDLGIDPKGISESYAMAQISREKNLGKSPTSKTNILKTMQVVVSAMLGGEYKALSHDVNYLLSIYSKKGRKALSVVCANHRYMRQYMAEICHRIITNGKYEVEYKAKKS